MMTDNLILDTHDWQLIRKPAKFDFERGVIAILCYTCAKSFMTDEEHIAFAMNRLENG